MRGGRAHAATVTEDLPDVVDALRVDHVRVHGRSATADVCNWALCGEQRLRKSDGSWKIDSFQLPVND
jgi:hypothetical protein